MTLAALSVLGHHPADARPTGHPRRRAVDAVIVHSLGGPDCRDGRRFYRRIDGDARTWIATFRTLPIVSIHYVIGRDGRIEIGVPESEAATHAVGWNQRSIGIELVNNGDGSDPFSTAQIEALVRLVREVRGRHPAVTARPYLPAFGHRPVDVPGRPVRRGLHPVPPQGRSRRGFSLGRVS